MGTGATASERRRRWDRVAEMIRELPEGGAEGDQHLSLTVRGKRFGYLLEDHHGDGRTALVLKAAPGVNVALAERDPERFHIPAYVGPRGWLGLWLDVPTVDWDEVEELVLDAYCLAAPKRLTAQVRGRGD